MKRFFLLFMMGGLSILLIVSETKMTSAALSCANERNHVQRGSTRVEGVSIFTAGLTTILAVREFRGTVTGLSDLADKRVATISGSTSSQYLIER